MVIVTMVIVTVVVVMMVVVVVVVRVMDRTPFFEVCLPQNREINDRIEKRNNIYDYISHAESESFF